MYETILVFSFYTGYSNVIDQRFIFFLYENLVNKTFCKQCFQAVLKNEFNVDSKEWKYIYRCKLLDMSSSLVKILQILTRSF